MPCQKCNSDKIVRVNAKCNDQFDIRMNGKNAISIPVEIGSDDYISFVYCRGCGQIQHTFPIMEDR